MARRMVRVPKHRGLFGGVTKVTEQFATGATGSGIVAMDSGHTLVKGVGNGGKRVVRNFLGFFVPKQKK